MLLEPAIYKGYCTNLFGQDGWILAKFFFSVYGETELKSINSRKKKNFVNIQPSSPNKFGQ